MTGTMREERAGTAGPGGDPTLAEVCVVACARAWEGDGEILASPFATIPSIGARLARATTDPDLLLTPRGQRPRRPRPRRTGRVGGGLLVLLLAARVRFPTGNGAQYGSGLLSGALLTSTGLNGPPVVLTLQGLDLPPHRFRGTLQVVFCAQDLVAVAAFVALGHVDRLTATVALAGILGVPLGWWLGDRVFGWLPAARFRAVVLSTLGVTALVSLWGSLS